jgi:hypothetical protein
MRELSRAERRVKWCGLIPALIALFAWAVSIFVCFIHNRVTTANRGYGAIVVYHDLAIHQGCLCYADYDGDQGETVEPGEFPRWRIEFNWERPRWDFEYRPRTNSARSRWLTIPLWRPFLVLGLGSLLGMRVLRMRARRRLSSGLCSYCGYSLTGNTSGVCPECGKPI